MLKKVILIQPPFSHFPGRFKTNYTEPPLGLLYLSSNAKKEIKNLEVKILDAPAENLSLDSLIKIIKRESPDVVGVSCVTITSNFSKDLAKEIKKTLPNCLTVAGGPHATVFFEDLTPNFDVVVLGEGEKTFSEILKGNDLNNIKGIAFDDKKNSPQELIENLDEIPYPNWELLNLKQYLYPYPHKVKNKNFARIITSRGCPYDCKFCSSKFIWTRKVRQRTIPNVLGEIKELIEKYNIHFIFISDDTFIINKERVMNFCDEILKRKIKFSWACLSRCNNLSEEVLRLMKRAGCEEIQVGVESGDENILRSLNKKVKLEEIREGFKTIKKVGLQSKGFFILGSPQETKETIKKTINFAKELDPTYAFFSIFVPYPGLESFNEYKQKGYLKTLDFSKFNYHSEPVFETENLNYEDLIKLKREAEIKFYFRVKKIIFYFWETITTGNFRTMWRNFLVFLNNICRNS